METRARLGPYRLDELTGEGSVARVYKAWHMKLQRYEALKLLRDSMAHEATIVARFLSEARTAARLHHPHIATIYSVGDGDGSQPYFTMEMVEGCDLGEHLRRHGPLTLDEAAPLLHQIASAVDYAHSLGVVHRDIKPANILLGDSPSGGYTVKLVDFGIARVQAEEAASRLTQTGGIVGTPKYISPEQANEQPVDYRADIYSLGVVAYEMMCGRTPFEGDEPTTTMALLMAHVHTAPPPPRELAPALSQTTNDAILRSLAKSPDDRFSTCGEFVRVLTAPQLADAGSPATPHMTDAGSPTPPRITDASAATRIAAPTPPAVPTDRPAASGARSRPAFRGPIGAGAVALLTFAAVFAFLRLSTRPTPIGGARAPASAPRHIASLHAAHARPTVSRPASAPVVTASKSPPRTAAPAPAKSIAAKPATPTQPKKITPPITQAVHTVATPVTRTTHIVAAKAPVAPPAAHAASKAAAMRPAPHVTAKAPATPDIHSTANALAPPAKQVMTKARPAAHAVTPRPPTPKAAPKPIAAHPNSAAHPKLAARPIKPIAHAAKPASRPIVHPAKPASRSIARAAKPASRPIARAAKRIPHAAMAYARVRAVAMRERLLRRKSRALRTHMAARLRPRRALADAWESSSRQEMALAHSFHAQGDSVQAAALAQNAADSRRRAQGAPATRKRKRR